MNIKHRHHLATPLVSCVIEVVTKLLSCAIVKSFIAAIKHTQEIWISFTCNVKKVDGHVTVISRNTDILYIYIYIHI